MGGAILSLPRLREYGKTLEALKYFIVSWSLGVITTSLTFFILMQIREYTPYTAICSQVMFIVTAIIGCINETFDEKIRILIKGEVNVKRACILSLFSLVPFIYIRSLSQYPYQIMVDGFVVSLRVKQISIGQYKFHYYMGFPVLLHCLTVLYKVDIIEFLWAAPITLYMMISFSTYLLARQMTKNEKVAVISSILSSWLTGGGMICEIHAFLPKNVLYVCFPLVLFLSLIHI